MIGHVQQTVRRKISDFIHLEDGRVGTHKAITTAAIVTSSALAGILLTPQPALAVCPCDTVIDCQPGEFCCWIPNSVCGPGYDYGCMPPGGINPDGSCR